MGFEYALVHLKYTIPPAIALTLGYRPLFNRIDLYKIVFLVTIAVAATIPWDSFLIRRKIWTYPPSVIVGPTLFSIPAEEVFFFVIQTYNTSLLYLILSKPLFHPNYLVSHDRKSSRWNIGYPILATLVAVGAYLIWRGKEGTYMGLILAWAGPVALMLWIFSSEFLLRLPYSTTLAPIVLPTLYLWVVDTIALRRGTWTIESGTKLGIHVWDGLEIEEAIFFLATNTMIVFGLVAFDHALTILHTFPDLFPAVPDLPPPMLAIRALLTSTTRYDRLRVNGIQEAVGRLQRKSRSFYLASATFSGRLRIDLILLYSFCRVADDLVDNATSETEARQWIKKIAGFLDLAYASDKDKSVSKSEIEAYISDNFPESSRAALLVLPTHLLSPEPLYDLLEGFKTDLEYKNNEKVGSFPITSEHELEVYATRVAGTVAELCLELVFHHSSSTTTPAQRKRLITAGGRMGVALQYVNIARDIATDATIGRVYIPTQWLDEEQLYPEDVITKPEGPAIDRLRARTLNRAFAMYEDARSAMAELPVEARAPMKVAVESYMEIGRVLREKGYVVRRGRATVPKLRRLRVAWRALNER